MGAASCHGIKQCCSWILVSEASNEQEALIQPHFPLVYHWGVRSDAEHSRMMKLMVPAPGWHVQALQLLPLYPYLKKSQNISLFPLVLWVRTSLACRG